MSSNYGSGANTSDGVDNFHSIIDLLLFHYLDRQLYGRLIRNLFQDADRVRMVMALWLWFESIGHHDFVKHVHSFKDKLVLGFMKEAERCVAAVMGRPPCGADEDEIPLTAWLIDDPIDLGFFIFNQEHIHNGISQIYDKVCKVIFNDHLMLIISKDGQHPHHQQVLSSGFVIRPFGEGTSRHGAALGQLTTCLLRDAFTSSPTSTRTAIPNPEAIRDTKLKSKSRPFAPLMGPPPSTGRSIFITFLRGYPISEEDIVEFFDARYGKCVEYVMIEHTQDGTPPMYGKMVFISSWMINVVLNGQCTAKFFIKGQHLWARMYEPHQN